MNEKIKTNEKISKRLVDAISNVNELFLLARDSGLDVLIQKDEIYDGEKPVLNQITIKSSTYRIEFIETGVTSRQ